MPVQRAHCCCCCCFAIAPPSLISRRRTREKSPLWTRPPSSSRSVFSSLGQIIVGCRLPLVASAISHRIGSFAREKTSEYGNDKHWTRAITWREQPRLLQYPSPRPLGSSRGNTNEPSFPRVTIPYFIISAYSSPPRRLSLGCLTTNFVFHG